MFHGGRKRDAVGLAREVIPQVLDQNELFGKRKIAQRGAVAEFMNESEAHNRAWQGADFFAAKVARVFLTVRLARIVHT